MRPLFISLAIALVLGWLGFEMRHQFRAISTMFYILSGMLVTLGLVAVFGLNT